MISIFLFDKEKLGLFCEINFSLVSSKQKQNFFQENRFDFFFKTTSLAHFPPWFSIFKTSFEVLLIKKNTNLQKIKLDTLSLILVPQQLDSIFLIQNYRNYIMRIQQKLSNKHQWDILCWKYALTFRAPFAKIFNKRVLKVRGRTSPPLCSQKSINI